MKPGFYQFFLGFKQHLTQQIAEYQDLIAFCDDALKLPEENERLQKELKATQAELKSYVEDKRAMFELIAKQTSDVEEQLMPIIQAALEQAEPDRGRWVYKNGEKVWYPE